MPRAFFLALCLSLFGSLFAEGQRTPRQPAGPTETAVTVSLRQQNGMTGPPGILIMLETSSGLELNRTMTDSRGKVEFAGLKPDSYKVSVRQLGYKPTSAIVFGNNSPNTNVSLVLIPIAAEVARSVPPEGPGATVSAAGPSSNEGKKALQLGQDALLTAHDPAKSLPYFEQLNKKNPEYVSGWLLKGTALMALNRPLEAEGVFREAVLRQPDLYPAQFGLGVSLNEQGHFDKAVAPLSKCVNLMPASAEAHYELSRAYFGMNDFKAAEAEVSKAISADPKYPPSHVVMGNVYLRKHDAQGALKEFDSYLLLSPDGAFAPATRQMAGRIRKALGKTP